MDKAHHLTKTGWLSGFTGLPPDAWGGLVVVAATLFSILFFSSLIWVFLDARSRDKSGCIALLFILLVGWPLSFVWWLWLRPPLRRGR